ncbi:MAG: hypothetical protein ACP5KG_06785 [Myxococcota bacterium]
MKEIKLYTLMIVIIPKILFASTYWPWNSYFQPACSGESCKDEKGDVNDGYYADLVVGIVQIQRGFLRYQGDIAIGYFMLRQQRS